MTLYSGLGLVAMMVGPDRDGKQARLMLADSGAIAIMDMAGMAVLMSIYSAMRGHSPWYGPEYAQGVLLDNVCFSFNYRTILTLPIAVLQSWRIHC